MSALIATHQPRIVHVSGQALEGKPSHPPPEHPLDKSSAVVTWTKPQSERAPSECQARRNHGRDRLSPLFAVELPHGLDPKDTKDRITADGARAPGTGKTLDALMQIDPNAAVRAGVQGRIAVSLVAGTPPPTERSLGARTPPREPGPADTGRQRADRLARYHRYGTVEAPRMACGEVSEGGFEPPRPVRGTRPST
jgi:hypothetical protein